MTIVIRTFLFFGFIITAAAMAGMVILVTPLAYSPEVAALWFMTSCFAGMALFFFVNIFAAQ